MATIARQIVTLSKPRIVALLVFTAVCGLWKAADGAPGAAELTAVIVSGGLAASGSNAINQGSTPTSTRSCAVRAAVRSPATRCARRSP